MADGRYTLGEELGRGALGRVVRVVDNAQRRALAGKILHRSHQVDARASARFAAEAQIVAELRHPNIASVYGIREINGERVLLMELVDGDSLGRVIAVSAPLPEARVVALGRGIAAGLAAAHHSGLIHRDLKPDNVLVTRDGVPKLVDFGLARATSFAGIDAGAFAVVGTPDYMAPESIDPLAVDPRSDLYALGCILFEMVTGAPPFTGATAFAVIESHRQALVDVAALERALSPPLVALVASLLSKSPADRPQSAAAVAAALDAIAREPAPNTATLAQAGTSAVRGATSPASMGPGRAAAGVCASCGASALPQVGVCFGCGAPQVSLEAGDHTVFITGPGEVAAKLDSQLRQVLIDWLEANPALALDTKRLTKRVPRLPFVLVTGVAQSSGVALCRSLESLGFSAQVCRGGPYALPAMRKKGSSLGGRVALIAVSGWAYGLYYALPLGFVPAAGLVALAAMSGGFVAAARPTVTRTRGHRAALPDHLSSALARVGDVVPSIGSARHRDSLRAVVQRALAVRDVVPEVWRDAVDADLGHLIDLAVIGASRVDQIDTVLSARDLRNPDDGDRKAMRERDNWAARLLEITAFLDAMRVRYVAVTGQSAENAPAASTLDELRAHIEALEELSALS